MDEVPKYQQQTTTLVPVQNQQNSQQQTNTPNSSNNLDLSNEENGKMLISEPKNQQCLYHKAGLNNSNLSGNEKIRGIQPTNQQHKRSYTHSFDDKEVYQRQGKQQYSTSYHQQFFQRGSTVEFDQLGNILDGRNRETNQQKSHKQPNLNNSNTFSNLNSGFSKNINGPNRLAQPQDQHEMFQQKLNHRNTSNVSSRE